MRDRRGNQRGDRWIALWLTAAVLFWLAMFVALRQP